MITVELHRADLATVTITPPWWKRLLFGEREEIKFAARMLSIAGGFCWRWDSTGRAVELDVQRAIDAEERAVRRWQVRQAIEPPG